MPKKVSTKCQVNQRSNRKNTEEWQNVLQTKLVPAQGSNTCMCTSSQPQARSSGARALCPRMRPCSLASCTRSHHMLWPCSTARRVLSNMLSCVTYAQPHHANALNRTTLYRTGSATSHHTLSAIVHPPSTALSMVYLDHLENSMKFYRVDPYITKNIPTKFQVKQTSDEWDTA